MEDRSIGRAVNQRRESGPKEVEKRDTDRTGFGTMWRKVLFFPLLGRRALSWVLSLPGSRIFIGKTEWLGFLFLDQPHDLLLKVCQAGTRRGHVLAKELMEVRLELSF